MLIGEKIRELRQKRNLTQTELSLKTGIKKTTVFHLEAGTIANPGFKTICDISDFFGISTDELKKVFQESQKEINGRKETS